MAHIYICSHEHQEIKFTPKRSNTWVEGSVCKVTHCFAWMLSVLCNKPTGVCRTVSRDICLLSAANFFFFKHTAVRESIPMTMTFHLNYLKSNKMYKGNCCPTNYINYLSHEIFVPALKMQVGSSAQSTCKTSELSDTRTRVLFVGRVTRDRVESEITSFAECSCSRE